MDRRRFAQLTALGAVAPQLLHAQQPTPATRAATPDPDATAKPVLPGKSGVGPAAPVSVEDFRRLAQAKLPAATYDYVASGSTEQVTLRENTIAFQRIKLLPPVLHGVGQTDLTTAVLGQQVSLPVLLAPVAAQRLYHAQGALASARGAAAAGTLLGVSSSATNSLEEIAAASACPKWYQLYMPRDRAIGKQLVERAERAGYKALIVTVDLGEFKDADRRNRFALPREMLIKHLRDVGFTGVRDDMTYDELVAYNSQLTDLAMSWDVFAWLRSITSLPLMIKGILRREDAEKAVTLGLDGIIVSNHGGRRLDGMPASIDMLPGIVEVVAGRAEIFLDSGVRRGTDVVKALALGARAVLIGRPYVWGLATDGERGVRAVVDLLRDELKSAMLACGCATVKDVRPRLVLREPG